ncbi:OpgC domain-containing protein [Cognatishimia activa]|uniref:OpgC protein n=1 Tax=Cognatishimia activa TaxID=1715691 RepID=A0A0P1IVG4_9RHOB|nr:OpgC domain-containing protein [Cognatishimia activa]CUJ18583.1 OpgC protein [Cognatishimia activa]CUK27603.1 OpgC protein [Cognatishimia activa]
MRIVGLDFTRSLAIFLAMASHAFNEAGLYTYLPAELSFYLKICMQLAPPVFIVLFGVMLELVYLPRMESGRAAAVSARLWTRALQCWLLYAISIFVLFLVRDDYSLMFSLSCIFFMGNSPYTEILKLYTVLLFLSPLLILIRIRFGLGLCILFAIAYQIAWPIGNGLAHAMADENAPIQFVRFVKFITGFGDTRVAGPSVLHGVSLMVAGWALTALLRKAILAQSPRASTLKTFEFDRQKLKLFFGLSFAFTVLTFFALPSSYISGIPNMELRMMSHPVYFICGTSVAYATAIFLVMVFDSWKFGSRELLNKLSFFGRTSLFTFAWGNILLYLINLTPDGPAETKIYALSLTLSIVLMSYGFDVLNKKSSWLADAISWFLRPFEVRVKTYFEKNQSEFQSN